jgi:hypothetical protein
VQQWLLSGAVPAKELPRHKCSFLLHPHPGTPHFSSAVSANTHSDFFLVPLLLLLLLLPAEVSACCR